MRLLFSKVYIQYAQMQEYAYFFHATYAFDNLHNYSFKYTYKHYTRQIFTEARIQRIV